MDHHLSTPSWVSNETGSAWAKKWRITCFNFGMQLEELKKSEMMTHLLDSLEQGKDIGHYGRLTVVMVAQKFLSEDELVELLTKDPDCDEEKARSLIAQVASRGYNPPKRERILDWMQKQEFPICPHPDDAQACNVYREIEFPKQVYDKIHAYYEGANG